MEANLELCSIYLISMLYLMTLLGLPHDRYCLMILLALLGLPHDRQYLIALLGLPHDSQYDVSELSFKLSRDVLWKCYSYWTMFGFITIGTSNSNLYQFPQYNLNASQFKSSTTFNFFSNYHLLFKFILLFLLYYLHTYFIYERKLCN